jgi:hypothetical protein
MLKDLVALLRAVLLVGGVTMNAARGLQFFACHAGDMPMNTTPISTPNTLNTLSQTWATQQASAAAAVEADSDDDAFGVSASGASGTPSTGLTGSATGTLDSQTMQALLDLVQTDPSDQGTSQGQTQATGAHHHHHHGGMKPPADPTSDSSTASGNADASSADGSQPLNNDASDDLAA